jgi:hypothetical protein
MAHEITIGSDPQTHAEQQASLVRGDIKTGAAEPLGPNVVYKDPGPNAPDVWKSPAEVNAAGAANCNSLTRAAAPFVDASHIGVIPVKDDKGNVVRTHSFAVTDAKPGEAPIVVGGDGKAITPIPADRIHDESALRGMPGGHFPLEAYQNASLAPIHPPHLDDLSHVHAPAADRVAEGLAYQGDVRLHSPQTDAGAAVAAASHLAARVVTPPVQHVPRPVDELYPGHPLLNAIGESEDAMKAAVERVAGWPTSKRMINEYHAGLTSVARGVNPAPLAGDGPVTEDHKAAAAMLKDHLETLGFAQRADASKPTDVEAAKAIAATVAALPTLDVADPAHDAKATVVSEVAAMLPSTTPRHVRHALVQVPIAPFFDHGSLDYDRDGYGESLGLGLALGAALASVAAGHPGDGQRPERPRRATRASGPVSADPSMGAASAGGGGGGPRGGASGSPLAPSPSGDSPAPSGASSPPGLPGLPASASPSGGGDDRGGRGERDGDGGRGGDGGPRRGFGRGAGGGDERDGTLGGDDDEDDDDSEGGGAIVTRRRTITNQLPDRVINLPGTTRYVRDPDQVVTGPGAVVPQYASPVPGPVFYAGQNPWLPSHVRHGWGQGAGGEWQQRGHGGGGSGPGGGPGRISGQNWMRQLGGQSAVNAASAAHAQPGSSAATNAAVQAAAAAAAIAKANGPGAAANAAANKAKQAVAAAGDPGMAGPWFGGGLGGWGRGGPGGIAGDRYAATFGDQSLRRAVWAWRNDPAARMRLESGLPVHGYMLADVMAAAGDPSMGGPYGKGMGVKSQIFNTTLPTGGNTQITPGAMSLGSANMSPGGGGGGGGGPGGWPLGGGSGWPRHHYPPQAQAQTFVPPPVVPAPVYLDAMGNQYPYPVNPDGTPIGADPGMGGRSDRGDRPPTSPWGAAVGAAVDEDDDDAPAGRRGRGPLVCQVCPSAR